MRVLTAVTSAFYYDDLFVKRFKECYAVINPASRLRIDHSRISPGSYLVCKRKSVRSEGINVKLKGKLCFRISFRYAKRILNRY